MLPLFTMDFYKLDREFLSIERHIKLLFFLRPTNIRSERKKFLRREIENPSFSYPRFHSNFPFLRKRLHALQPDGTPLGRIFRMKRDELIEKLNILQARGSSECLLRAQKLFGGETGISSEEIEKILSRLQSPKNEPGLSAEEVKIIFEKTLYEAGLKTWRVRLTDGLVSACSVGKRKTIFVRKTARFTLSRVHRLIAHEIETHLFTAENGKFQPYKIFQRGLPGYLETQEGLALFMEIKKMNLTNVSHWEEFLSSPSVREYVYPAALLFWNILVAEQGSFRDTYEELRSRGIGKGRAFRYAVRVKRGLSDTAQKGAFPKDFIYLSGLKKIFEFMNSKGDFQKLYLGKVSLQTLPFLSSIQGLVPPRYIPLYSLQT